AVNAHSITAIPIDLIALAFPTFASTLFWGTQPRDARMKRTRAAAHLSRARHRSTRFARQQERNGVATVTEMSSRRNAAIIAPSWTSGEQRLCGRRSLRSGFTATT